MVKIFLLLITVFSICKADAQKHVGIGTTTPLAALHVADSSVLFTGPSVFQINPTPPPINGPGGRMMWYPAKGAFRAGAVSSDLWDQANIGNSSFAAGFDTKASSYGTVAMGENTTASGFDAVAFGLITTASGSYSFASGRQSSATGVASVAMGQFNDASGHFSVALGLNASTNNHDNSFCFAGIPGSTVTSNTTNNQMMMRFDNYTFWVSPSNFAYLIPASNGWAYTSDITKKEKFEELDGETVLQKISKIPFYSWNFKAAEVQKYRHYGIMAQDFYNAFGQDSYGTIGNDTTVSPLDLLGVAYSAIKALEQRSSDLATENRQLQATNQSLEKRVEDIEKQVAAKMKLIAIKLEELETLKSKNATNKNQ